MRIFLVLLALAACDDAPSTTPEPVADALPDPPDAAADAAPADAAPLDAGLVDAAPPDAALPNGVPQLNELDCDESWVELVAAAPTPPGWQLRIGTRSILLDEIPAGFQQLTLPFHLSCGQSVALLDPSGAEREVAAAPLGPAALTFGRLPDGSGPWQPTAPTPGAANRAPTAPEAELFDGALHRVAITLAPGALEVLDREWEKDVQATLEIDGAPPREALLRISGFDGRARRADQKTSLRIRWVEVEPGDLGGLDLRPALVDPAFFTEQFALEMLGALGLVVPRAGFAAVQIDGQDLGPFLLLEAVDAHFSARHFASTWHVWRGLRADLGPDATEGFEVLVGDGADRRDLVWLGNHFAVEPPIVGTRYQLSQDAVDWPAALRALAAEAWLGSVEGYGPTGNLLRAHVDQGPRLTLVPDGLDVALRNPVNPQIGRGRLMRVCLEDPNCITAYEEALVAVHTAFAAEDWPERLRSRAAALRPALAADPAGFWPVEMFDEASEARARFLEDRLAQVSDLIECLATPDADGDGRRCAADCAPEDPAVFVGATDVCGNGLDEDCSGLADDGPDCPRCTEVNRAGKRYLICPQRLVYSDARTLCEGQGARLTAIDGPGENAWLFQQASRVLRQDYWIGLDDSGTEGTFLRLDDSPPPWTNWSNGEPNDYGAGEDCAHLRPDGLWNDIDCRNRFGAICDFPCDSRDLDEDGVDGCALDCDDTNPELRPGAVDLCGDGLDQDCSGVPDDGPDCPCTTALRGEHRYLFCPEGVAHGQIARICLENGLQPVRIDHASENHFLYETARTRRFQRWWIALSDIELEGQYRWIDGSPLRFAAWSRGEPNDSGRVEDCIHFWEDRAEWNDIGCGAHGGVICEAACAPGTDEDEDGAEGCGADCDDGDASRNPGAGELCDGVDQDCDTRIDEGCP